MIRRLPLIALHCALLFASSHLLAKPAAAKPGAAPKADAAKPDAPKPELQDPSKAEAAQRFDRGLTLFNEGDNAGALAEFKQTYALMPNPIVLFNIGLVYAAMGRPVDAVDALNAVVDSATLSPEQRERATSTLSDQRARIGRLSITTVPEGARIDVDGVEVAKTPLTGPLRVAEGTHVIGAVAEGYAHAHKEITVAGNAEASLNFELVLGQAKRPANVTVQSRIPDAEVFVDEKSVGKTPLATSISVPAGKHSVELRRAGYKTAKQDVEVGEGATGEVTLDLSVDSAALSKDGADFTLQLREPNVEVSVDDERLGLYSRPLHLPPGLHHMKLEVAGYLPFEQDVTLIAGSHNTLSPYLSPTPETRAAHDSNVRAHRIWGWIGVGAGAAIAGTGVALVVTGSSDKSSAQRDFDANEALVINKVGDCATGDEKNDVCNGRVLDAQARVQSAKNRETIGFVGIGVGAAVLATGVIILVTGESSHRFEPPAGSAAKVKPNAFALTPGPGQFGLGLAASF